MTPEIKNLDGDKRNLDGDKADDGGGAPGGGGAGHGHGKGAKNKLSLVPLIFLIFFEVAGGPYGAEPAVQSAGPLYALLGFLIFPFIWAIPEALVTAELSTAMPGNGGFVLPIFRALDFLSIEALSLKRKMYRCTTIGMIAGDWLKYWIEVGAVLSSIGLYSATLSSAAFQLLGMADLGLLPRVFALRAPIFNTPWVSIVVTSLITLGMSFFSFNNIVTAANFLYSLGMLLEFATFIWLRIKRPEMSRPYRVPLRLPGIVVLCLVPSGFLVFVMAIAGWKAYAISAIFTAAGLGIYYLMKFCNARGFLKFGTVDGEGLMYERHQKSANVGV
ncbi:hypothetical protein TRIUR3_02859 [Triticum urartu]|uniref:Polyamine transporter n=1 Tax=Triticum urartu TaxID=4572 RepID=M8A1G4_TRIUA|nr:hypothetical protein TRIUR3_02859 [Triticum urartu]